MNYVRLKTGSHAVIGTCLQGYIDVPFSLLVQLFGEPEQPGEKVSTEWVLKFDDGTVATIYDYKETSLYDDNLPSPAELRANEFSDWHVGGRSKIAVQRVLEVLQRKRIDPEQLSVEGSA